MGRRFLGAMVGIFFLRLGGVCADGWELGPFVRAEEPILTPFKESVFRCPVQQEGVCWEAAHTFNPAAVVRGDKVYLFYRAEDDYGVGVGRHTSRIGIAESEDGICFQRHSVPVLFPDLDDQKDNEFPGGCEDPRIVETEEGTYVMMYTQWNRQIALLSVATSEDLFHWRKHGYAFGDRYPRRWSKSGAIVCRRDKDRLIAVKIQGKYWMYWGDSSIYAASSEDLITWTPLVDGKGQLSVVLGPREGKFDSMSVEPGPPAVLTEQGIVFLYNGRNSFIHRDPKIKPRTYSAGQVLLDSTDPTQVIDRCESCFLTPQRPYEINGQYKQGTVFVEGLVHFHGAWFVYYGAADSAVGAAVSPD